VDEVRNGFAWAWQNGRKIQRRPIGTLENHEDEMAKKNRHRGLAK